MNRKKTKVKPKRTRLWTHDIYRYICTGKQDEFANFLSFEATISMLKVTRNNGCYTTFLWDNDEKCLKRYIKEINKW